MSPFTFTRSTPYKRLGTLLLAGILAMRFGARPTFAQEPASSSAASPTDASLERKVPHRALLYSGGGTVSPFVGMALGGIASTGGGPDNWSETALAGIGATLFVGGWTVGPSLGHIYAEASDQVWTGMGIRATGLVVAGVSQVRYLRSTPESERGGGAPLLGLAGLILISGSAVYDVLTAPRSVREYNEAHGLSARITPTVGTRGEQIGLALRATL